MKKDVNNTTYSKMYWAVLGEKWPPCLNTAWWGTAMGDGPAARPVKGGWPRAHPSGLPHLQSLILHWIHAFPEPSDFLGP